METKEQKKIIEKEIYHIESDKQIYLTQDIINLLEPNDIINSGFEEPEYASDHGHDGYYYLSIYRNILETDEEFKNRLNEEKELKEDLKKRRYENYLKLKKEFEN